MTPSLSLVISMWVKLRSIFDNVGRCVGDSLCHSLLKYQSVRQLIEINYVLRCRSRYAASIISRDCVVSTLVICKRGKWKILLAPQESCVRICYCSPNTTSELRRNEIQRNSKFLKPFIRMSPSLLIFHILFLPRIPDDRPLHLVNYLNYWYWHWYLLLLDTHEVISSNLPVSRHEIQ